MNNRVDLYLESATDYSITEVCGRTKTTVSVEHARKFWELGRVRDFNLAFDRLTRMNRGVNAVKAFYARGGR